MFREDTPARDRNKPAALRQERYISGKLIASQRRNASIEGDQTALVPDGESKQIGIGHLTMTNELLLKRLHSFSQRDVERPKAMARLSANVRKHLECLSERRVVRMESPIGNDSHKPGLRQWACRPRAAPHLVQPGVYFSVRYVVAIDRC